VPAFAGEKRFEVCTGTAMEGIIDEFVDDANRRRLYSFLIISFHAYYFENYNYQEFLV
jgi:hypothetical protein